MHRWLSPPVYADEYLAFSGRILHYTLLLLLALSVIAFPFTSVTLQRVSVVGVMTLFGLCYVFSKTGRLRIASLIFLIGLWSIITFAAFNLNGVRNSSLVSYVIIIIYSAILLSRWALLTATAASILSVLILALGESAGVLPIQTTPLFLSDRLFQLIATYGATGILLFTAERVIRGSIARARQQEQLLIERNKSLEAEILERRRVEASLRASEEKYRIVFENNAMLCAVYDREGRIQLVNDVVAQFFNTTRADLEGKTLYDIFTKEDADYAIMQQQRVLDSGVAEISEGVSTLPTGKTVHFLRHIMPLPNIVDASAQPTQVLVITTDLTAQKLAEQQERELAFAREKNAFFTDFLSTVSHDLKTPLSVMNTSLYLIQRSSDLFYRQEKLDQLKIQVALLEKYIQDMLTISRLEHLPELVTQAFDLNVLVKMVVDMLRPRADKKAINVRFVPGDAALVVTADAEQVQRMLVNLIENAINYTPVSGQVDILTAFETDYIVFEVRDTGIGISAEDLPHVFDRFYRAEEARSTEASGTGLGLAIVRKIVEMHHASIEVHSEAGHGTTFRVKFPDVAPLEIMPSLDGVP